MDKLDEIEIDFEATGKVGDLREQLAEALEAAAAPKGKENI